MAHTLGAPVRVDLIIIWPHRNGLIRTSRLTDITIDTFVCDDERHGSLKPLKS
jgi:hypothetical protein